MGHDITLTECRLKRRTYNPVDIMVHAKDNPKQKVLTPIPEIYTRCEIQNKSRDEYIQGKKTGTVLTCNHMYHAPHGPPANCKSSQGVIWLVPYKITVSYPKDES